MWSRGCVSVFFCGRMNNPFKPVKPNEPQRCSYKDLTFITLYQRDVIVGDPYDSKIKMSFLMKKISESNVNIDDIYFFLDEKNYDVAEFTLGYDKVDEVKSEQKYQKALKQYQAQLKKYNKNIIKYEISRKKYLEESIKEAQKQLDAFEAELNGKK